MSSSMTPNDRESLSALFDGELDGDAARFALRRLEHDADWRDACSRWQLAGDVLRGQAPGVAPMGFADRVSAALVAEAAWAEPVAMASGEGRRAPISARAQEQSLRWWGRAALAASVAVAALFVTHPFSGSGTGDGAGAAGTSIAAIPAASSAPAPIAAPDAPATPAGGAEVAAVGVAVADVPRRVSARRTRAGAPVAATQRSDGQAPVTMALAAAEPSPRPAAVAIPDPFKPQPGDLVSRPWPRAVLPGGSAAGALTASFGAAPASPSFYPFEPDATHVTTASAEATPQP